MHSISDKLVRDQLKTRFFNKPWPYAIIGALLILCSTFLIGVITFKAEQTLLKTQQELEGIKAQEQEIRRFYDMAHLQIYLAVLQRSVSKANLNKDIELENKSQRVFVETLFSALMRLHIAAGNNNFDQEEANELKRLSVEAVDGNNDSFNKIKSLILETLLSADKKQGAIIDKKAILEKNQDKISEKIINWKNLAMTLQIVGLVLLLAKELPEHLWGTNTKKNDKSMQKTA